LVDVVAEKAANLTMLLVHLAITKMQPNAKHLAVLTPNEDAVAKRFTNLELLVLKRHQVLQGLQGLQALRVLFQRFQRFLTRMHLAIFAVYERQKLNVEAIPTARILNQDAGEEVELYLKVLFLKDL
jgi:hypothetical protein